MINNEIRHEIVSSNPDIEVRFYLSEDEGRYVAPHWHNSLELVYMLEGSMTTQFENNVRQTIEVGEISVVNPRVIHSVTAQKNMDDGTNIAKKYCEESKLPEYPVKQIPGFDDFNSGELGIWCYSPRIMPHRFADVKSRPGWVRLRGQEARTSLNKTSILARKLTSVYAQITTKMDFTPEVHQHSAGLILYYDNMNYINLRKYYSETLGQSAISVIQLENGEKTEFVNIRIPVDDVPIYFRLVIEGRHSQFYWSYDGENYEKIGIPFDTTKFSDEYCKYGEFTGTMVGITCADRVKHKHYADFDFFEYIADESKNVE